MNLGLGAHEVCTRSSFEEEGEEERERRKEREREGRRDQKRKNLHACKDLVLVHAVWTDPVPMDWARVDAARPRG